MSLSWSSLEARTEVTPTVLIRKSVVFFDDLLFKNLNEAIERQLESYKLNGLTGTIKFGTKVYNKTILKDSLILLKNLSHNAVKCLETKTEKTCLDQFNQNINSKFSIYAPVIVNKKSKSQKVAVTKFTSYFSPDFHGSKIKTSRFSRPIYRMPEAPYHNFKRNEIDFKGALSGKGYEIFWVEESLFDIYLLHIQGGGRINLPQEDGPNIVKYLSYDGKNTHSFKMISNYMVEKGYLTAENKGVNAQRKFLLDNPEKEEEIFNTTPSYVYFKESEHEPVGLNNISLTEGRSLAIDAKIYKTMGLINFVKTQMASHIDENGNIIKVPFSRFFISQDTGGAIRGKARCDLYFGYGPLAELVAYNMDDEGEQYFLIKK